MHVTGVILAGGKSRRMGRDQAFLPFGKGVLIERVIEVLRQVTDELLLISNTPEKYEGFGLPMASDVIPEAGSLGGMYTGLVYTQTPYSLYLACEVALHLSVVMSTTALSGVEALARGALVRFSAWLDRPVASRPARRTTIASRRRWARRHEAPATTDIALWRMELAPPLPLWVGSCCGQEPPLVGASTHLGRPNALALSGSFHKCL